MSLKLTNEKAVLHPVEMDGAAAIALTMGVSSDAVIDSTRTLVWLDAVKKYIIEVDSGLLWEIPPYVSNDYYMSMAHTDAGGAEMYLTDGVVVPLRAVGESDSSKRYGLQQLCGHTERTSSVILSLTDYGGYFIQPYLFFDEEHDVLYALPSISQTLYTGTWTWYSANQELYVKTPTWSGYIALKDCVVPSSILEATVDWKTPSKMYGATQEAITQYGFYLKNGFFPDDCVVEGYTGELTSSSLFLDNEGNYYGPDASVDGMYLIMWTHVAGSKELTIQVGDSPEYPEYTKDLTFTALDINGSTLKLTGDVFQLGSFAGKSTALSNTMAIGHNVAQCSQSPQGSTASPSEPEGGCISLGFNLNELSQSFNSVNIGSNSGKTQEPECINIGNYNALYAGTRSITIGNYCGSGVSHNASQPFSSMVGSIGIGGYAGYHGLKVGTICIGDGAGRGIGKNENATGTNEQAQLTGFYSVVIGMGAAAQGCGNTSVAIGYNALNQAELGLHGTGTIFIGYNAGNSSTTQYGNNSFAIGTNAHKDSTGETKESGCIGTNASTTDTNQVRIGGPSQDVYAKSYLNVVSDMRDKADICEGLGYDFIMALRACQFRYDTRESYFEDVDVVVKKAGTPSMQLNEQTGEMSLVLQTEERTTSERRAVPYDGRHKGKRFHQGLLAQEVKAVMDAQGVDFSGYREASHNGSGAADRLTLQYEAFIAPLISTVQTLNDRITEQGKLIDELTKLIGDKYAS